MQTAKKPSLNGFIFGCVFMLAGVSEASSQTAARFRGWVPLASGVTLWTGTIARSQTANKASTSVQPSSSVTLAVVRADPAATNARVIDVYKSAMAVKSRQPAFDLASVAKLSPSAVAILNGGATTSFSIPNHAGFLVTDGRTTKPLVTGHTALTGVFCIRTQNRNSWAILRTTDQAARSCYEAIQAGPLLIENGRLTVYANEVRLPPYRRSVACVDRNNVLYLIVASTVSLYDLGKWLITQPISSTSGLGCVWAINLDGGSSSGLILPRDTRTFGESTSTIASAIAVTPK